uniref:Ig-like domain-containing protein n=1 Tax=Catharus ustulatus TaxID=91951 RepID=A0A8C3UWX7_CATUS
NLPSSTQLAFISLPYHLEPTCTSDTEEVSGTVGRSVIFRTQDMTDGNAFWNFGNDPIVTASFEDPPHALFSKPTFEKRFAVSEKGRALSISQLRLQDAGTYSVTIGEKRFTFILHVYSKWELAEPTVTCEAQNCSSDGNCRFSLRCSVSGTDLGNVSYTWREGDRPWDEGSMVLWVNKSDLEVLGPLRCTARNPVSNRSVTVRTPDLLCAGESWERWEFGMGWDGNVEGGVILPLIPKLRIWGVSPLTPRSVPWDMRGSHEGKINGFCPLKVARNLGFKQTNKQTNKHKKKKKEKNKTQKNPPKPKQPTKRIFPVLGAGSSSQSHRAQGGRDEEQFPSSSSEGFWGQS